MSQRSLNVRQVVQIARRHRILVSAVTVAACDKHGARRASG
jgi:hypothetical protein